MSFVEEQEAEMLREFLQPERPRHRELGLSGSMGPMLAAGMFAVGGYALYQMHQKDPDFFARMMREGIRRPGAPPSRPRGSTGLGAWSKQWRNERRQ